MWHETESTGILTAGVATGGEENDLKIWDLETGACAFKVR